MIDNLIEIIKDKKSDAQGTNSKCWFVKKYALLYGPIVDNLDLKIKYINKYKSMNINIPKIIEYKIEKNYSDKENEIYNNEGWILEEKVNGELLSNKLNCVNDIESFIMDVIPKKEDIVVNDFTNISKEVNDDVINNFIEDVLSFDIPVVKEYHNSNEEIEILDNYIEELCI